MLRTVTEWTGVPGAPYYTVLHFFGTDATQASGAHAGTAQVWDALGSVIRDDLNYTVLPEVSVVDEVTGDTTATWLEDAVSGGGGQAGARQPLVIQGLVRLRTGTYVGGREVRGRVFVPGTVDMSDDEGVPSASYLSLLTSVWNTALADLTALGVPLQVYSPTNGVAADVTGASPWNQWAILRSRRD